MRFFRERMRAQSGFTLVEVLAALLILGTGAMALVGSLDFSRKLTSSSEVRNSAADRAQREIERIQSLPYSQVAHPTGGIAAVSTNPADPTSRIAGTSFKYDRKDNTKSSPLVTAAGGAVAMKQVVPKGADDRFGYTIWRFVTSANDASCGAILTLCPSSANYKRVTVVVSAEGLGEKLKPVWTSTIAIDPRATAVNNLTQPVTTCLNAAGDGLEQCVRALTDTVTSLFLTDTSAGSSSTRQVIAGSHNLHRTVGPYLLSGVLNALDTCRLLGTGCPVPDLLDDNPLPIPSVLPSLYKYSQDVPGSYSGGRALMRDAACNGTPSGSVDADNRKGGFWASAPLAASKTYNGKGGLSIYTHTLSGVPKDLTLCMAVYSVPNSLANLIAAAPTELGRASYNLSSWPGTARAVAFPFTYRSSNVTVAAGRRVGVRLWVAGGSADDIALIYDHPAYPTRVELQEPGP